MNLLQIRFISEPSCVTPCSLVAVSMPWTPSSLGCLDELFPKKQHNSFSLKTNFYQMNGESFFSLSPPRRFLPFLQRDLLSSGSRKMELDQCPYFLLGNWSPSSIALGWRAELSMLVNVFVRRFFKQWPSSVMTVFCKF